MVKLASFSAGALQFIPRRLKYFLATYGFRAYRARQQAPITIQSSV
jgi:hypothetical protein